MGAQSYGVKVIAEQKRRAAKGSRDLAECNIMDVERYRITRQPQGGGIYRYGIKYGSKKPDIGRQKLLNRLEQAFKQQIF